MLDHYAGNKLIDLDLTVSLSFIYYLFFCPTVWAVLTSNYFKGQMFRKTKQNPSCCLCKVSDMSKPSLCTTTISGLKRVRLHLQKYISTFFFASKSFKITDKQYKSITLQEGQKRCIGYANLKC